MVKPRIIVKSGNPLICLDDIVLNIDSRNSGKSYFKLKPQFRDKKIYYSYVFRRLDFIKELRELNKTYSGIFYIEFTETQKRNRKLKRISSEESTKDINIQNEHYYIIEQPDISRIMSIRGQESDNAYNVTENMENMQKSPYNFTFVWTKLKDSNIQLEVKKLKYSKHENQGVRKQTYYHCIFDETFTKCIHADSHYFNFDKESFERLKSGGMAPKTKGVLTGRNPKAKYDQFAMAKDEEIPSCEALVLLTKFLSDTRVNYYFKHLIEETSILKP